MINESYGKLIKIRVIDLLNNNELMKFKGVNNQIFSVKADWHVPQRPSKRTSFNSFTHILLCLESTCSISHKTQKNKTLALRKEREENGTQRETGRKEDTEEGGGTVLLGSKAIFLPFSIHFVPHWPLGEWELLVIGAIHVSIRLLQDPTGSALWSGNPQSRDTWDEVSTCLRRQ